VKIVVYGASGYQGRLVLAELARRGVEPVLAGRDAGRLRAAAATLGPAGAETRVAALGSQPDLVAALRGCDAVINCAGPFTANGPALVDAATDAGAHYVDTAGEQPYVKAVFDTRAEQAERAGVTVVPAANDGCAPIDLLAQLLARRLGPLEEIITAHLIDAVGMSRGSLRSILGVLETIRTGGLVYDDGGWRAGMPPRRASVRPPGAAEPVAVMPFPMTEVVTIPRHVAVRHVAGYGESALGAQLSAPPPAEMIDGLPEGPDERARRAQRFTYLVDALALDGRRALGVVRGADTYGTTAVVAAEAAVRLATDGAKPGVLAPAQAFDPTAFLAALAPRGVTWTIEAP
jgi:short subunit dehydrogenase-like uncharacterized protein